ncbi:MAG: VanZ family protein [Lachnospiraceae bacterium]|nr:VanZ family protein [Lachnospiraceae bacterium]
MTFKKFVKTLLRFILKPLSFIPALLMMYIIFSFSAQDGTTSANQSYKISYKAVSIADRALDLQLTDKQISRCIRKIHFYVRKIAHFTEYFLLAVTVAFPLYVYGIRGIWLVIAGGILCVGFAALDELHQYFVGGRSCSVRDVIIDSGGSLIGILIVRVFGYIGRKTIFEPLISKHQS